MGTIRRRTGSHSWEGVSPRAYDDPAVAGVEKHELIGPADGAHDYSVRYFHVPAGGRTAHERHPHDHGVVIVSGRARVTLGGEQHQVGPGDSVYIEGDELHGFEAVGPEPLGFICVVPPRPATGQSGSRPA